MKRKRPLSVPENERQELLTHLEKLDSEQKKMIIKTIKEIKTIAEDKKDK